MGPTVEEAVPAPAAAAVPPVAISKASTSKPPAPMHNLYTAVMGYNVYTITDGALRLIVLLHADSLGFNAIEIAFMFSMYEIAGIFTNLFGGVVGSMKGLRFTLIASLLLQMVTLGGLMLTDTVFGDLEDARGQTRLQATVYITAWQALAGVAKDFMKLTGKGTPKLVSKEGDETRLFQLVAWLTGMKNALKGLGHFLGSLLVFTIGYTFSLLVLLLMCALFTPVGYFYMDKGLGKSVVKEVDWYGVFHKPRNFNLLSLARFFLFCSRDVWFEIALPLFIKNQLEWNAVLVGLFMAGYIVAYGNLQAMSTKLYKKKDGGALGHPTVPCIWKWAAACSLVPLLQGTFMYLSFSVWDSVPATAVFLILGLAAFAGLFAVNSACHSYFVVSFSNKDKVAQDLGFYYMANAGGRLGGTLLGGVVYFHTSDDFGMSMNLWLAVPFLVLAALVAALLGREDAARVKGGGSAAVGDTVAVAGQGLEKGCVGQERDVEGGALSSKELREQEAHAQQPREQPSSLTSTVDAFAPA